MDHDVRMYQKEYLDPSVAEAVGYLKKLSELLYVRQGEDLTNKLLAKLN